jgi:hypothetical protein
MILLFPQATTAFNQMIVEMFDNSIGDTFLEKSFGSYDFEHVTKVVVIVLKNTLVETVLSDFLSKSSEIRNYEIVVLERETSGSICSILMATPLLNNESVIISALDQIVVGQKLNFNDFEGMSDADVIAPTYGSDDPLLCYTLEDEVGNVIQLFEKKRVSGDAILGMYFIRDFSVFFRNCHELLIKFRGFQDRIFYTSDVINSFIGQNAKCYFPSIELTYIKVRSSKDMSNI